MDHEFAMAKIIISWCSVVAKISKNCHGNKNMFGKYHGEEIQMNRMNIAQNKIDKITMADAYLKIDMLI